jgi:hypothetical protein
MLRFYWSLVREIPAVLRNSAEAWVFWILTIGVPLAVWFNPQLQASINTPQFSRWFVLVPIAVSVVYGMLRVNYQRFCDLVRGNDNAASRIAALERQLEGRQKDQALADALTELYQEGVRAILNGPPFDESGIEHWRTREREWQARVLAVMREHDCTRQELNHVEMIGLFPVHRGLHHIEAIARDLSMFAVRLSRVADISTRYTR